MTESNITADQHWNHISLFVMISVSR